MKIIFTVKNRYKRFFKMKIRKTREIIVDDDYLNGKFSWTKVWANYTLVSVPIAVRQLWQLKIVIPLSWCDVIDEVEDERVLYWAYN